MTLIGVISLTRSTSSALAAFKYGRHRGARTHRAHELSSRHPQIDGALRLRDVSPGSERKGGRTLLSQK
jgi:hypothetical protein